MEGERGRSGERERGTDTDARLIFLTEGGQRGPRNEGDSPIFADTKIGTVPITLFENGSTRGGWFGPKEVKAFLAACDLFLRKNRPDIVVTYGGDPVSIAVQRLVKRLRAEEKRDEKGTVPPGTKGTVPFLLGQKSGQSPKSGQAPVLVFWLHNFAYHDRAAFALVDYVVVPSEFSRRYYREKLGLECQVLPNVVHWAEAEQRSEVGRQRSEVGRRRSDARIDDRNIIDRKMNGVAPAPCPQPTASYVTFINPQEIKGVYVFARIARELARRRPDIPILVTQGRSRGDALRNPGLGLAQHLAGELKPEGDRPIFADTKIGTVPDGRNITTMPFTPDPRDFYPAVFARTRLLLMPSLWLESFGLVAAEAMLNGIPVLASDRGALPGTIGDAGFLFDIPARYTSETRKVPMAEEVEPWVEAIIRLWDDAAYYEQCSRAARERAQAWHPDRLAPLYREFFFGIAHRALTRELVH